MFDTTVIIGAGAVGKAIHEHMLPHTQQALLFDCCPERGARVGDALAPSGELAAALSCADLAVLALPEQTITAALPALTAHMSGRLVVETGSVKTPVLEVLDKCAAGTEVLGINPLFAPSLGFRGQRVAVVHFTGGERSEGFGRLITQWGSDCVALAPHRHDELLAVVQAGAHAMLLALGALLARSGASFAELDAVATPPFRTLLLLLSRILTQSPEVYWDIQAANPHAASQRRVLADELAALSAMASAADPARFASWISNQVTWVGSSLSRIRSDSDALLSLLAKLDPPQ